MKPFFVFLLLALSVQGFSQNEKNYSQTFNSNSYYYGVWNKEKKEWDNSETIQRVSKITIKNKKVFLSDVEVLDILDNGRDAGDGEYKSIQWSCKDKEGVDAIISLSQFENGTCSFSIVYLDDCNIYDINTTPDVFGSGYHFRKIK